MRDKASSLFELGELPLWKPDFSETKPYILHYTREALVTAHDPSFVWNWTRAVISTLRDTTRVRYCTTSSSCQTNLKSRSQQAVFSSPFTVPFREWSYFVVWCGSFIPLPWCLAASASTDVSTDPHALPDEEGRVYFGVPSDFADRWIVMIVCFLAGVVKAPLPIV